MRRDSSDYYIATRRAVHGLGFSRASTTNLCRGAWVGVVEGHFCTQYSSLQVKIFNNRKSIRSLGLNLESKYSLLGTNMRTACKPPYEDVQR